MPVDMSRYLSLFVGEATEHLEALTQRLIRFEKHAQAEDVDALFRHAHSVKSMAASMGFDATATLAHRMEDLLTTWRAAPGQVDRDQVDLMLAATDALATHVKAAADAAPFPDVSEPTRRLTERLVALGQAPQPTRVADVAPLPSSPFPPTSAPRPSVSPPAVTVPESAPPAGPATARPAPPVPPPQLAVSPSPPPSAPRPSTPPSARPSAPSSARPSAPPSARPRPTPTVVERGLADVAGTPPAQDAPALPPRFALRLRVSPQSNQPGVRAFLAWKRLTLLGNVFDLRPPLDALKAGKIPDGLVSLELETTEPEEAVRKTFRTIADVELLTLRLLEPNAPPAPPAPPPDAGPRVVGHEPQRTVRVQTELLDQFLDLAGELLLATSSLREVGKSLPAPARPPLDEAVDRLHGLVKGLHDKVMKARMTPISVVTDRLPRAARDIARRRGREVDFSVTGSDIELDRSVVDELADPLLHVLRNSVDHGIETPAEREAAGKPLHGQVTLRVHRERDRVIVELEDDGRGMDAAKLRAVAVSRGLLTQEQAQALPDHDAWMLCCMPGVSTSDDVSDISGRGVGMDAVKRVIDSVGGTLDIRSTPGRGTTFVLSLPLTVAVVNLLLVGVGDEVFGLPLARVSGVVEESDERISRSHTSRVLGWNNALVPVFGLADLLALPAAQAPAAHTPRPWVVVDGDGGKVALGVDALLGQEEVVLKALQRPLDLVPGLAGVTILGSGRAIFILDVARLVAA